MTGNKKIHYGAERFNQVVCQIESILFIVVKDAHWWMQSMQNQLPGNGSSKNGITIIQATINGRFINPGESITKQIGKVPSCRPGFQIPCIA